MDRCSRPSALVPAAVYPYFQHPEPGVNLDEQENQKRKKDKQNSIWQPTGQRRRYPKWKGNKNPLKGKPQNETDTLLVVNKKGNS